MTDFAKKTFTVPCTSDSFREGHKRTFGESTTREAPCGHAACIKKGVYCLFEPGPKSLMPEKWAVDVATELVKHMQRADCVKNCGRQAKPHSLFCSHCSHV